MRVFFSMDPSAPTKALADIICSRARLQVLAPLVADSTRPLDLTRMEPVLWIGVEGTSTRFLEGFRVMSSKV